jgi:hypothetical protein
MLSSVSGDQLCSLPAVQLWSLFFTVLVYWRPVSLPCPLSLGKVSDLSAGPLLSVCSDALLFVLKFCRAIWLWMLLTGSALWTFTCIFQAVTYRLPTVGPPAFPTFVYWKFVEICSLHLPLLHCDFSFLPCLLCASFQFIFNCSFFFCIGVSLPKGLCWLISGVAGGIPCDAWCSPDWSSECLPSRFRAGVWRWQQPSCFLSVTCCGEAFYRLGAQGIEVLIFLSALYLPSVAPVSQQDFWFTECTLCASVPLSPSWIHSGIFF